MNWKWNKGGKLLKHNTWSRCNWFSLIPEFESVINSQTYCPTRRNVGEQTVIQTLRIQKLNLHLLNCINQPEFFFYSWRPEWVVSRWTSSTFWALRPCSISPFTASTPLCGQQEPPCNLRPGLWASRPGQGRGFKEATSWSRLYPRMTAGYALLSTWHGFRIELHSKSPCRI